MTSSLYDDGWTKPHVTARIRVFSYPGQTGRVTRSLTIDVQSPSDVAARRFSLVSNTGNVNATAGETAVAANVSVCVPPNGSAEIRLSTPSSSYVYGDPTSELTYPFDRHAGVLVTQIYLSGQLGAAC